MDEQFKTLRRVFNKLKSRWVTSGDMAASIHAKYLGLPFRTPRQFDFIIGNHNRYKFEIALINLGYELISTKSGRRNLRFEKRGSVPVQLHLSETSPSSVSYNIKTPIQKLEYISNVQNLINYKNKLRTHVNFLMRNINVN